MERHKALLDKYLKGTCTPEERRLVEAWYNEATARQQANTGDGREHDWSAIDQYLVDHLPIVKPVSIRRKRYAYAAAAAAVVLALAVGWGYLVSGPSNDRSELAVNDLPAGTNKAMLTLASGRAITLAEHEEIVVGKTAVTYADGSVVLENDDQMDHHPLTLTTPVGGQYRIVLPDGSRAWLNAASSITYPRRFSPDSREISITGEVYLEVAKLHSTDTEGRVPFIVHSPGQRIEVLGTTFNVKAYADEEGTTTSLFSGSVRLIAESPPSGTGQPRQSVQLNPGQQAVNVNGKVAISELIEANAVAWKSGKFVFRSESLTSVLKQLQRWYGFTIDYDTVPDLHFTGGIKRDVSLSAVLNMLEATSSVRFRIENKRVMIVDNLNNQ